MKVVLRKRHLKIQKNPPAHHNSSFSRKNISGNTRDIEKKNSVLKLFLRPILFHGQISFDNLTYFKLYGNLNGAKSWLIVKTQELAEEAERVFGDKVSTTTEGKCHLGAV